MESLRGFDSRFKNRRAAPSVIGNHCGCWPLELSSEMAAVGLARGVQRYPLMVLWVGWEQANGTVVET